VPFFPFFAKKWGVRRCLKALPGLPVAVSGFCVGFIGLLVYLYCRAISYSQ